MADLDARLRRGAHRTRRDPVRFLAPVALVAAVVLAGGTYRALEQGPDTVRTRTPAGGPVAGQSRRPTTARTPTATPTTSASKSPSAQRSVAVVVYNATDRKGLGGRLAEELREAGWRVPVIQPFEGDDLAETTVYYPDGKRAAAELLAEEMPGEPKVAERYGELSRTRLTVVIGDDYPA
jgi:hypothetical protein